jgi:tRNA(Ile)-lysidine synthase
MELEELRNTALQFCHLDQAAPLLVGVSGGPDSLCLLDGLSRLGFQVIVAHFDHHLRPESGLDAAKVRVEAESRGAMFVLGSGDVVEFAHAGRHSLEEAARILRYRFLFEQAHRFSTQAVAVGHTADDQVETVLMHLLRGAALSGLQGMAYHSLLPDWDASIPLVRPLLPFWRAEILDYCHEQGLEPITDQTNQDVTYFRNRLRQELIPFLESYNPQVRKNLWNTAQALAGDATIVKEAIQAAWEACLAGQGHGYVALRLAGFLALSVGVQRGLLRKAIATQQSTGKQGAAFPRDVDFETVERAIRFTRRGIGAVSGGQVDLIKGLCLSIEGDRLLIRQGDMQPDPNWPQLGMDELHLPVPGEIDLASGWRLLSAWMGLEGLPDFSARQAVVWEAWLDADSLPKDLYLRRMRPGDRFEPLGMDGHSLKLSDFWINQKLPRRARPAWPLVAAESGIIWVPGFRMAHPFRVRPDTRLVLYLSLKHDR